MNLTQVIYHGLCDEITSGKLKPGEVLSRRKIAKQYGASYTPVIEAMVRLENSGLIETESSQMARVRRISVETIESDYVLREAYETQAIRLACASRIALSKPICASIPKGIDAEQRAFRRVFAALYSFDNTRQNFDPFATNVS